MDKKVISKAAALVLSIASIISFSGCALIKFENPDEAKEIEGQIQTIDGNQKPDVFALLDPNVLTLNESLKDASGNVIATYEAAFPYFDAGNDQVLQNINSYYETEFEQIADDCQRFFNLVNEKPTDGVCTSVFSYQLLESPENYICILRLFEGVDTLGAATKTYYLEVFSASTGWKLRFNDIFGENSARVITAMRESIEQWSFEQDYSANWLYNLGDSVLTENISFDDEYLYLGLPAFTAPGGETLIQISFADFAEYLQ